MFQFFAGLLYEFVRLFAAFGSLGAMAYGFSGIVRNSQDMFERGLFLGLIAVVLALLARGLRRFQL